MFSSKKHFEYHQNQANLPQIQNKKPSQSIVSFCASSLQVIRSENGSFGSESVAFTLLGSYASGYFLGTAVLYGPSRILDLPLAMDNGFHSLIGGVTAISCMLPIKRFFPRKSLVSMWFWAAAAWLVLSPFLWLLCYQHMVFVVQALLLFQTWLRSFAFLGLLGIASFILTTSIFAYAKYKKSVDQSQFSNVTKEVQSNMLSNFSTERPILDFPPESGQRDLDRSQAFKGYFFKKPFSA